MLFFSPVPHGEVENDAREEATLCHTQKKACGVESSHALSDAQQGCDYAPGECECRKPYFGRGQFQGDIARYLSVLVDCVKVSIRFETHFKEYVADKIQSQAGKVLVPGCEKSSTLFRFNELKARAAYSYASLSSNPRDAHLQLRWREQSKQKVIGLDKHTITAIEER